MRAAVGRALHWSIPFWWVVMMGTAAVCVYAYPTPVVWGWAALGCGALFLTSVAVSYLVGARSPLLPPSILRQAAQPPADPPESDEPVD